MQNHYYCAFVKKKKTESIYFISGVEIERENAKVLYQQVVGAKQIFMKYAGIHTCEYLENIGKNFFSFFFFFCFYIFHLEV